jgi:RNA polymerase sigma-70 factor (ECF subfamily)
LIYQEEDLQESENFETSAHIDHLVNRAIEGDGGAFGSLYDVYLSRIYRHVFYRVGNTEDAEDITQQTFVKAWKAIGRYKKTSSPFLAWLMKISHNLVIDHYRAKKDKIYLNSEIDITNPGPGPEQIAEANYTQQQLRKVILLLPEEQQQVILMSFIEGFSYSEIAAALGKREGNIRVIVHRALKRMRELLKEETFKIEQD